MDKVPDANDVDSQGIYQSVEESLRQMEENMADAEVQTRSCQELFEVVYEYHEKHCFQPPVPLKLNVDRVCGVLMNAMRAHPSHAQLHIIMCRCLELFIRQETEAPDARPASRSAPSPEYLENLNAGSVMIAQTFINHPKDKNLQMSACRALTTIFVYYSNSLQSFHKKVPACAIFGAVMTALTTHKQDVETQRFAMDLMRTLSGTLKDATEISKPDTISAVLKSMVAHKRNVSVQMAGCMLLHTTLSLAADEAITPDIRQTTDILWKHGTMGIVLGALDTYLLGAESQLSDMSGNRGCEDFVKQSLYLILEMYMKAPKPRPQAGLNAVSSVMARHLQVEGIQELLLRSP
jgi:hypothetical protein